MFVEPRNVDIVLLRRSDSAFMRSPSAASVAISIFPQTSYAMPCSSQKLFVATDPRRQRFAFKLPDIIDSGVNDAAVATRLVLCQTALLLIRSHCGPFGRILGRFPDNQIRTLQRGVQRRDLTHSRQNESGLGRRLPPNIPADESVLGFRPRIALSPAQLISE
jgi:hypothetical protein